MARMKKEYTSRKDAKEEEPQEIERRGFGFGVRRLPAAFGFVFLLGAGAKLPKRR
jgi:hypothetical protein